MILPPISSINHCFHYLLPHVQEKLDSRLLKFVFIIIIQRRTGLKEVKGTEKDEEKNTESQENKDAKPATKEGTENDTSRLEDKGAQVKTENEAGAAKGGAATEHRPGERSKRSRKKARDAARANEEKSNEAKDKKDKSKDTS